MSARAAQPAEVVRADRRGPCPLVSGGLGVGSAGSLPASVAEGRLRPETRLAVWASIFVAGLILAIAFPIERGASQAPTPASTDSEPTPTPDPLPDPNPAQPSGGSARSLGDSFGESSGDSSVASSSGAGSTIPSTTRDDGRSAVASRHRAQTNLRSKGARREAAGLKHARERGAKRGGLTPHFVIGNPTPAPFELETILLILAGALALLLVLTAAVLTQGVEGVSASLTARRAQAVALLWTLICAFTVGLLVALLVGQPYR
jgi:hypothetical protein